MLSKMQAGTRLLNYLDCSKMKKALICGVSGQDGSYLAEFLLKQGYSVVGTSRDAEENSFKNLKLLGIINEMQLLSLNPKEFASVLNVVSSVQPDEIYNLSSQSSVALSFQQPLQTFESIIFPTLYFLEAIRFLGKPLKFYNSGSSEMFGNTENTKIDETTPLSPKSPYSIAKATAHWEVLNYRESYGIFACTGILFNHESPFRPNRFVTKKIISSACRIAKGSTEKLVLGNINIHRDWGWAPEYVQAMWRILQQDKPDDFIIATGTTNSLEDFVRMAFEYFGLDWKEHAVIDAKLFRPTDINCGVANPSKAASLLDWKANVALPDIIKKMIEFELKVAE